MNSFLRNVLTILRGTVLAQVIGFIALAVLARTFPPSAFGNYQIFMSTLAMMLVAASMRYEIAILRAADAAEFSTLTVLCFLVNIVTSIFALAICTVMALLLPSFVQTFLDILWLLPLALLIGGVLQTLGYCALRFQSFVAISRSKIAQVAGYGVAGSAIGILSPVSNGLVWADLAGRLISIGSLLTLRASWGLHVPSVSKRALVVAARKYREFPLMSVPGGLINAAGGALTPILIYGTFEASTSGQYGLVERALTLPVGLIAIAVSQVFTADFSKLLRSGSADALRLYRQIVRTMFKLGIVPAILVIFLAPYAFAFFFGETWRLAGEFAQIMGPLLLVIFISVPVNMTILLLGRQKIQAVWEVTRLLLMIAMWGVVVKLKLSPVFAVTLHVAFNIIMYLLYLWLADTMIRSKMSELSR